MRRTVLVYALLGYAWIIGSGYAFNGSLIWRSAHEATEVVKGLFFITTTAVFLLVLLERLAAQLAQASVGEQQAKNRLAAAVDSPLMGIAAWVGDGKILDANDALLSMWGYTREQFEAERPSLLQMSPKEFHARDVECLRQSAETGAQGPYEKVLLRRDGSHLPVITGVTTVPGKTDEGLLFVVDDTERRAATEALSKLLEELERRVEERTRELQISNEELESFGYSVSHDLRAPLRSIDGMAVLITKEGSALSPDQLHAVERIRHNVSRMSMLVDALLQLSRTTRAPLTMADVDLTQVFELALADVRSGHPERDVEVVLPRAMTMRGDASLLRVMAHNLLDNAFKFTSHAVNPKVEILLDGTTLTVRDNGVGFDPSVASGLFRPFHRLHSATEFPGTGIGLAIVQRIVRRHQGTISVTAQPGMGASFKISLPTLQLGTENAA